MATSGVDVTWVFVLAGIVIVFLAGMRFGAWAVRVSDRTNLKIATRVDADMHGIDSLVNVRTGEVVSPDARKFNRIAAKQRVVFREEE